MKHGFKIIDAIPTPWSRGHVDGTSDGGRQPKSRFTGLAPDDHVVRTREVLGPNVPGSPVRQGTGRTPSSSTPRWCGHHVLRRAYQYIGRASARASYPD